MTDIATVGFENWPPETLVVQRFRLDNILRRHVRAEDESLTDDNFVRVVLKRYAKDRGIVLVDVNE